MYNENCTIGKSDYVNYTIYTVHRYRYLRSIYEMVHSLEKSVYRNSTRVIIIYIRSVLCKARLSSVNVLCSLGCKKSSFIRWTKGRRKLGTNDTILLYRLHWFEGKKKSRSSYANSNTERRKWNKNRKPRIVYDGKSHFFLKYEPSTINNYENITFCVRLTNTYPC